MNVEIYILECIIMCIVFGTVVMSIIIKNPVSMISDYPPEIQDRYYQTQGKAIEKEKMTIGIAIRKIIGLIIFAVVFAWMVLIAGGDTFFKALFMTYGYMFVIFAFDTFFLDWVLFANIKKVRLPGTEDMDKEYHQKWFHVKACFPMIPVFLIGGLAIAGIELLIYPFVL